VVKLAVGVILVALVAAGFLYWLSQSSERAAPVAPVAPPVAPADRRAPTPAVNDDGARALAAPAEAERAPAPERTEGPSAHEDSIQGSATLANGPATSGFVFAWEDGLVPVAEEFRADSRSIHVLRAPIQPDGGFRITGLAPRKRYTLTAVARGAVCAA